MQVVVPGGDPLDLGGEPRLLFGAHPDPPGVLQLQQPRVDRQRHRLVVLLQLRRQLAHRLPEAQRVARPAVAGPIGAAGRPAGRLACLAALAQVLGDQRRQLVVAVGVELDHRPRRGRVGGGPAVRQLGAVGDLAGQRVAEGQHPLRVQLRLVEEAGLDQLVQDRVEPVGVDPSGHPQRLRRGPPCRPPRRPAAAASRPGRGGRSGPPARPARSPARRRPRSAAPGDRRRARRPGSRPRPARARSPR